MTNRTFIAASPVTGGGSVTQPASPFNGRCYERRLNWNRGITPPMIYFRNLQIATGFAMKTHAKTFIFSDCQQYGIPNGVHFALKLTHGVEVILFPNPPNFEAQSILGDDFQRLLDEGRVVDAEAHVNALLKDGLSTVLSRD